MLRTMMWVMGTNDHGAALMELYDDAVGEVYRYHRSRCGNRAVAEDLTAETFLAAVAQIRHDGVERVTIAWLIGIARHKLVDHWRRTQRRPDTTSWDATATGPESDHVASDQNDLWDAVITRADVVSVLSELDDRHGAVLILRYLDGLPVAEVAEHLGRTVHATEALLVRARRRFRTIYEQREGGRR